MRMAYVILWTSMLLLGACSLPGSKTPEEHYYRLPQASTADKVAGKSVALVSVQASGIYNERAILYRQADRPLEVHRYHYHLWTQTPARLVHQYMQQYLQSAGRLGRDGEPLKAEIFRFERVVDGKEVYVDIGIRISSANGSKAYEIREKADGAGMHASVEAFGRGLDRIMQAVLLDLSK